MTTTVVYPEVPPERGRRARVDGELKGSGELTTGFWEGSRWLTPCGRSTTPAVGSFQPPRSVHTFPSSSIFPSVDPAVCRSSGSESHSVDTRPGSMSGLSMIWARAMAV